MAGIIDTSGISYFMPILVFLLVMIIVFAILQKIKLFENVWLQVFISFLIGTIFITAVGARDYVQNISIWFSVLIISAVFLFIMISFFGKADGYLKGLQLTFLIIGIIAFLISGMMIYGNYITPYLPWGDSVGDTSGRGQFTEWLYTGRVYGAILLVVVGAIVAFVLSGLKSGK